MPTVCSDCKGRIAIKNNLPPPINEKVNVDGLSLLIRAVKLLAKKKHSIDQIKFGLIARYPQYEKYITNNVIATILKQLCNINSKCSINNSLSIQIELDYSIFIGETNLSLKSTVIHQPVQEWILCVISTNGLYQLDISVGGTIRPCNQMFIQSIYESLQLDRKEEPFRLLSTRP